ncbi:YncE family protein [Acidobacterium sp. S8]|uniref:YncE family protein n=1 Tax=Acidobacterium sp. S8 TaxID=1641854 RepID=UPI00131C5D38|nr:hypothetical protein [Acidobacterium sp. S8]
MKNALPAFSHSFACSTSLHTILLLITVAALCGCGIHVGPGEATGSQPKPPGANFSLSLSPSSVTIAGGASKSLSISVTGSNGFNSPVAIQIAGLPSGVTISPSGPSVTPGILQQLTITASNSVTASTATVTFTGSSGSLRHTAQLSLTTQASLPVRTSLTRTRYVKTDAVNPYAVIYDSNTNRFFMSDPGTNQIMVLDAGTQKEIGAIAVPGAYGMDETPDHTTLYAGTQLGDIYAIDPVAMKVTRRYIASQIGSSGYDAYSVRTLSNGKLALLGGQGGIPGVDGYDGFAIWNPSDNTIAAYSGSIPNCIADGHIFGFTVTGDRALVVIYAGSSLCTFNPVTGQFNSANVIGSQITTTPDGKSILIIQNGNLASQFGQPTQIFVFDAHTLSQTASFPVTDVNGPLLLVSLDSKTLYITPEFGSTAYAYDIARGSNIGWIPDFFYGPTSSPWIQAVDNTGLLAGPVTEGIGMLDTAALRTGPVGTQFANAYLTPPTGPVTGGTQTQWNGSETGALSAVYFGGNKASSISGSGTFYGTTPPGAPGLVDVYSLMADGGMQVIPNAFSYGPTILEVTGDSSTAEGGGMGMVFGYGFGSVDYGAAIPTDLQISVGGKPVKISQYFPNAYNSSSPPSLLQAAAYTIPAGVAGGSADVTITTPSGASAFPAAIHYLPPIQQFPLAGAVLAQGIYDARRDLYYFTDAAEIRVFSKTQGQWLTPIQVPAAPQNTTHRLWGIALSPDGSKLAVSDATAGMIYLIDPDSTNSVRSFPFNVPYFAGFPEPYQSGLITNPAGLAVSDSGMIYFAAFTVGGEGFDYFFKLDTNSDKIKDYGIDGFGGPLYKVAISSDNSRVFFNNDGSVFSIDTATDTLNWSTAGPGCCYGDYDLALSSDNSRVEATSYLYDPALNAESYLVLNDREADYFAYVYGTKLSPDGSLLFQPSISGIDVFDGRLGILRTRISLPVPMSQNYDALVSDGKDNVLIAITGQYGSGIAIVDLGSLREPSHSPYPGADDKSLLSVGSAQRVSNLRNVVGANKAAAANNRPNSLIKHVVNTGLLPKQ